MAAPMYRVLRVNEQIATDQREAYYCRAAIAPANIQLLDGSTTPENSQFWIDVNQSDAGQPPNERFPMVRSYVDIFIRDWSTPLSQ